MKVNAEISREHEASLVILSPKPEEVVQGIAQMQIIGNYRLVEQDSITIHDVYFDTPESVLLDKNLALRLREIGENRFITLKGEPHHSLNGFIDRLEIEKPWSFAALMEIERHLQKYQVNLPEPRTWKKEGLSPVEMLHDLGLQVIQDRETQRHIRNIQKLKDNNSVTLAELDMDTVFYCFHNREIRHYELEIEAKSPDGTGMLPEMVRQFQNGPGGDTLHPWNHNKLITGLALKEIIRENPEGITSASGNINPEAYQLIENYIRENLI